MLCSNNIASNNRLLYFNINFTMINYRYEGPSYFGGQWTNASECGNIKCFFEITSVAISRIK